MTENQTAAYDEHSTPGNAAVPGSYEADDRASSPWPRVFVVVTDDNLIGLSCDDCALIFVVYDVHAERGHGVTPPDLVHDAVRHRAVCA